MSGSTKDTAWQGDSLERLLMHHVEGELDDAGQAELADMLRDDAAAQQRYLDYTSLHALLEWEQPAISQADQPLRRESESQIRRSWDAVRDFASNYITLSLVVSGLFFAILLLSMALIVPDWKRFVPGGELEPPSVEFVARITNTQDASWDETSDGNYKDMDLFAGEKLVLNSGLAEVTFADGAVVLLQGPGEIVVNGRAATTLNRGVLTSHVGKQAVGFVVSLPVGSIRDLGTDFGVLVEPSGEWQCHVMNGSVELTLDSDPDIDQERILILAGQSIRGWVGERTPRKLATYEPDLFPKLSPRHPDEKLFVASHVDVDHQSALPYQPIDDDLLQGLLPIDAREEGAHHGQLAMLTDGVGSSAIGAGPDGRVLISDGIAPTCRVTYDLVLPEGKLASVQTLRLFTYNQDSRVFLDADIEGSVDGKIWQPFYQGLVNGVRGVDVNHASGAVGDHYGDYCVTWISRRRDAPPVRFVRFTFRGTYQGKLFSAIPSTQHTCVTEIDLIGEIVPVE